MKKLFGLFLLALLVPDLAQAATCFWVGGTATWSTSNTASWSSATGPGGGGTCAATGGVPKQATDVATFDANSGGGVVTVDSTINGVTMATITGGAFTGTLDFSVNNPSMTLTASLFLSGTGTRTINLGSGTFTFTGTSGTGISNATLTNCTCTFSNANFVLTANAVVRDIATGGGTYGPLTINSNSTKGLITLPGAGTFASITVGSGNTLAIGQSTTLTVTGALVMTGTASAPVGLLATPPASGVATISVGSASTMDWGSVLRVTKSGAGSITATNSFDQGGNTSITITPPSASGGGRIIGG